MSALWGPALDVEVSYRQGAIRAAAAGRRGGRPRRRRTAERRDAKPRTERVELAAGAAARLGMATSERRWGLPGSGA